MSPGRAAPVLRYAKGILALATAAVTALIALPAGASWQLQVATGAAAAVGTGLVVLVPNAKRAKIDGPADVRWWQVYSHVLALSSSERTRQAAHREATREVGSKPPPRRPPR